MTAPASSSPASARDGRTGAPADRPARSLGLFGLLLAGVLVAGLGLGAAVGPLDPPGSARSVDGRAGSTGADHR